MEKTRLSFFFPYSLLSFSETGNSSGKKEELAPSQKIKCGWLLGTWLGWSSA